MYCNHCGKNLEPGTVCCPYCGQKAESLSGGTGFWDLTDEPRSEAAGQPKAHQQAAQPMPPVQPAAHRPEAPVHAPAPEQKQPAGKQRQNGNSPIAVIAAVLAAGALILGAVNLVQVKKLQKNVGELMTTRQTVQSAGENMPETSASTSAVTPEEIKPTPSTTPESSEKPTPTVSPETEEESAAETSDPSVSSNAVAENQSEFKVGLGSADETKPAVRFENKNLMLYFYADGVEENQEIKWWKVPADQDIENVKNRTELQDDKTGMQSNNTEENIILTESNDYVIFFTVGDAEEPSESISVLENKLLKVEKKDNVFSYEGINGFKELMEDGNQYTVIWETFDQATGEWEEAGTDATLTVTGANENKRIRAAVYSNEDGQKGDLVGYTEYKDGEN